MQIQGSTKGEAAGGGEEHCDRCSKKKRKDNPMLGLPSTAKWELLTPNEKPVPQPKNNDKLLRPPTELEAEKINPRYAYSETFDRFPFDGTTENLPKRASKKVSKESYLCFYFNIANTCTFNRAPFILE